jgi:hypothetical protein
MHGNAPLEPPPFCVSVLAASAVAVGYAEKHRMLLSGATKGVAAARF